MHVEHLDAFAGEAVDIGCLYLGAIATNVGEPLSRCLRLVSVQQVRFQGLHKTYKVVGEDEEKVRTLRRRLGSAVHDRCVA